METYRGIAAALSLDEGRDAEAATLLSSLLEGRRVTTLGALRSSVAGKVVGVWGAGPSLEHDLKLVIGGGLLRSQVNFVADGAVTAFLEAGAVPDAVFTDLDGPAPDLLRASSLGCTTIIHAHGDNMPLLRSLAGGFKGAVVGSTQVRPIPPRVLNLGGFTDGDRAAHWACELGASAIFLFGMDLGTEVGRHSKRGLTGERLKRKLVKLGIARDLLASLS
ncbi:MAG TPA: DUF115 domain-containing protein, partial [Candidatus Methanomethylicus sp.]|nr:DUF115 domain-containing protein [Candidatus Methanomethylicus sp.]